MIQSKKNREAIRTDKSVLNRSIFVVICVFLRVLQSETYFSDNHVTYYSLILHKMFQNVPFSKYTNYNTNTTIRIKNSNDEYILIFTS